MFKYLLLVLLIPLFGNAQILDSTAIYDHKEFENQTLKIYSDNGLILLQVLKPNLIKVSFSKKDNILEQEVIQLSEAVYVRITQNLESIFMQTDSLLIVISKLDFKTKFQNLKEELYAENQSISFANDDLNIQLSKTANEHFFKDNRKKLRNKIYSIYKLKSIHSSKDYEIYFDKITTGIIDFIKINLIIF